MFSLYNFISLKYFRSFLIHTYISGSFFNKHFLTKYLSCFFFFLSFLFFVDFKKVKETHPCLVEYGSPIYICEVEQAS